jgi:hypothetical protein
MKCLKAALQEQQSISFVPNAAFRYLTPLPNEDAQLSEKLTMREKILKAKKAGASGFAARPQVPTSKIMLNVSPGKGRATREVEIIYWPSLYKTSTFCKLQLRFFCAKVRTALTF